MIKIEELDWFNESKMILKYLNELDEDKSAIILLRHSHRNNISGYDTVNNVNLTEIGKETARYFGSNLPNNRQYRVYSSNIMRCKETAENILIGLKDKGSHGEFMGNLNVLTGMAGDGNQIFKYAQIDKRDIVFKWAAGHYSQTIIEPFTSYIQRAANYIWSQHLDNHKKSIDIFISHDFHIMSLQFGWSANLMKGEWVEFLGGFIVILDEKDYLVVKNGREISVEYPYWWPIKLIESENRILPTSNE